VANAPFSAEEDEQGTRLRLPPRERTRAGAFLGLLLIVASLGILIGGLWLAIASFQAFKGSLLHLVVAGGAFGWGLWQQGWKFLRPGFAEVFLTEDTLTSIDNFGRLRSGGSVPFSSLVRLEIEDSRPSLRRPFSHGSRLSAEVTDGTRIILADAYPRSLLEAVAAELRRRIAQLADASSIIDVTAIPPFARDVMVQPPASTILLQSDADTHTFILPRWGTLRTRRMFLLFMGLYAFLAAGVAASLYAFWTMPLMRPGAPIATAVAALLLACIAGAGLIGIHHYFRRRVLIVSTAGNGPPELAVFTRSPLRNRERSYPFPDLLYITVAPSSHGSSFELSSGDDRQFHLLLKPTPARGRRQALYTGSELETRWLATELRRLLNVPNRYATGEVLPPP
jgi:hypothetical protein